LDSDKRQILPEYPVNHRFPENMLIRPQGTETTPSVASTGHGPLVCDTSKA
jgi:hypothetical protein